MPIDMGEARDERLAEARLELVEAEPSTIRAITSRMS
jgi:hypothetical protein